MKTFSNAKPFYKMTTITNELVEIYKKRYTDLLIYVRIVAIGYKKYSWRTIWRTTLLKIYYSGSAIISN
ncbi:MAG: hypothetical protein WCP79_15475, partial [Bacillota bacterium]